MAAGVGCALWMRTNFLLAADPLWPHVLVVLALCVVALGSSALLAVRLGRWQRQVALSAVGFAFGLFWAGFYSALAFTLNYLGELPTRHIVTGYAPELKALLEAVPLTPLSKALALAAGLTALAATGVAGAFLFARSGEALAWLSTRSRAAVPLRALYYLSIVFLLFSCAAARPWHVEAREPLLGSWHNVPVSTNYTDGQRNPLESGKDAAARDRARAQEPSRRPNVIVIYVDALRADVTEPYGGTRRNMPFVSQQVATGQWLQVEHVLAACPATLCGLAAILQSRSTWLQSPQNYSLPKLLKDHGYSTAYVLSSNHQNYRDLKSYYEPIDFYLDGKDLDQSRGADDRVVMEGLARLGPWQGRPTFLMIGLVSTHALATKADEYRVFRPDQAGLERRTVFPEAYVNNYHNGVIQADAMLRRIWQFLRLNRYLEDAILVVTSDHGESLGEGGRFGHLGSLSQPELRIPLWFYETRPTVQERRFARQIDIAPTIAAALGLEPPVTWEGSPLQRRLETATSVHFVQSMPHDIAVVDYDGGSAYKLVLDRATNEERLFEILADPLEARDILLEGDTRRVMRMRALARKSLAGRDQSL